MRMCERQQVKVKLLIDEMHLIFAIKRKQTTKKSKKNPLKGN